MPCYDERSHGGYNEGYSAAKRDHQSKIDELLNTAHKELAYRDAIICAVLNELERKGIDEDIIAQASRHGKIDIMSYWEGHKKTDRKRLSKAIHQQFSKDELKVIKAILDKKSL